MCLHVILLPTRTGSAILRCQECFTRQTAGTVMIFILEKQSVDATGCSDTHCKIMEIKHCSHVVERCVTSPNNGFEGDYKLSGGVSP